MRTASIPVESDLMVEPTSHDADHDLPRSDHRFSFWGTITALVVATLPS